MPKDDLLRIERARDLRNALVHYVANVTEKQLRAAYVDFFEFAHVFHLNQLQKELHPYISEELWSIEATLMEEFRRDFVEYQGKTVAKQWPSEIVEAQFWPVLVIDDVEFERIRYGYEKGWENVDCLSNCHDCAALPGQLHGEGCDMEQCPRCDNQLFCCECEEFWARSTESEIDESMTE